MCDIASCRELSKELRINVLGYDYSGYGCSTGTPSVSNAIADIHACYQYLLQAKGKRPQDIVIYGQSVGSGPTCDIAASEKNVMGVVLHSPLMSGICKSCQRSTEPNKCLFTSNTQMDQGLALDDLIPAAACLSHSQNRCMEGA